MQLRTSDYKNHRIFSLRCLHKELTPVSIKLKSTLATSKARQIIKKAEKDLLQARVKAINNILDQVSRQMEECRAKLAAIISAERLEECQDFINKVSKIRFIKVRQRQINKFNHLVTKKEGNITVANAVNNTRSKSNSVNRQAPHNSTPATAHLPPGEGSNFPPATGHLPSEGSGSPQANSQASGGHPTPAIAHLPPREGSNSLLATVHPPLEGNSSSQANSQASGGLPTLAIAHLPPRKGSNSLPGAAHLPSWEDTSSSQAASLLPHRERNSSPQSSSSTHTGQGNNPPRSVRQGNRCPQAQANLVFPGSQHHLLGRQPHFHTPQ